MAQTFSTNLGLPATPSPENEELARELWPLYNAIRNVMAALDSYSGRSFIPAADYSAQKDANTYLTQNLERVFRQAGEAISAGNTISLGSDGKFYKGTQGKVIGFAPVAISNGSWGLVYLSGIATVSGLTPGSVYAAHPSTLGAITLNSSIASGTNRQILGIALSSTTLLFKPSMGMSTNAT